VNGARLLSDVTATKPPQHLIFSVSESTPMEVILEVFDTNPTEGMYCIGSVTVALTSTLATGRTEPSWYPISGCRSGREHGFLELSTHFVPDE